MPTKKRPSKGKAKKSIVLVGGFSEMIELCEDAGFRIAGVIDVLAPSDRKLPYWGNDEEAVKELAKNKKLPLVLSPDGGPVRYRLHGYYSGLGREFASVIHPGSHISRSARLEEGVVVQYGAVISANCHVGAFARINVGAVLMHDVVIGRYSTVAPCAVLLGRVQLGEQGYIGGKATVLPGIQVADGALIGAGAVVTKDVPAGKVARGVPARF